MSAIFDALPGMAVPVGAISKSLARMWVDTEAAGKAAPAATDVKATQVNFVLHFGVNTTPEDATAQFYTTVEFSKRYPSRVVVLCPSREGDPEADIRAKVYGECFLGKTKGDTRCVEFVVLNYPMKARRFLEDLVSTCLSTDLPLYYWAHRFSSTTRLNDYQYLLRSSKRVMLDTAVVSADALSFDWPKPEAVRDLAHARLLTVRQGLGQFLSAFPPAKLVSALTHVKVRHDEAHAAEARVLSAWLLRRLRACGEVEGVEFPVELFAAGSGGSLAVDFDYDSGASFAWRGDLEHNHADYRMDLGNGPVTVTTGLKLLEPAAALAEAVFF